VAGHLQPFGVLVEHRVDDVDKGLVAAEEAVPASQQITFQPALALMSRLPSAPRIHRTADSGTRCIRSDFQ
jgi:hypothetical protein